MKTQSRSSSRRPEARVAADDGPAVKTGTLPIRATGPHPAEPAATTAAEDGGRSGVQSWLTLENGLYLLFFVLALITRFSDLGFKGLHHDESLHSVFSWRYYMDQGYIHSPMMHGPEQFHLIDFAFLLFGATDATARFASAFCGMILVMGPFFLRRQLGRWPALIASFLFLISPTIMYFSRMAREDSIYAAMEMIFVIGLWRFIDQRKPRDFYVMCAGYSLMFTIKESAYLTTAIVGLLLIGLFAWQMGRWMFTTFLAYLAAAGGLGLIILKLPSTPALPSIPAQDPTPQNIQTFVVALLGHPLIQVMAFVTALWLVVWGYLLWDQSRRVRQAALAALPAAPVADAADEEAGEAAAVPQTVAATAGGAEPEVTYRPANGAVLEAPAPGAHTNGEGTNGHDDALAADTLEDYDSFVGEDLEGEPAPLAATVPASRRRVAPRAPAPDLPNLFERYQPGSVPYAVGYLVRHPGVFGTGLAVAVIIFVALYTSMFTNINGIGTGLFGSIGYWLAQQDVRRGDQPWFYYFIVLPVYEPLAIFFAIVGALYFVWQGVRALIFNQRTAAIVYALAILFFPIAIPLFILTMLVSSFRNAREDLPVVPGATTGFNVGKPVDFAEFRPFLVLFLITWSLGTFALYSWAGEKMPWLMIHIAQPLILLAALALGQLIKSMIRNRRSRALAAAYAAGDEDGDRPVRRTYSRSGRVSTPINAAPSNWAPWSGFTAPASWLPFVIYLTLFLALFVFWAMNITHRVVNNDYQNWWQLLIWPALLLLLAGAFWSLVGGSRILRYSLVGLFLVLAVYGVRAAIQLSFYNPMDAREVAVYVQTSPYVTQAADAIDRLSVDQTGTRDLKVIYDSLASWPWEWYLRDYKNKQFLANGPGTTIDPSVAVLILELGLVRQGQVGAGAAARQLRRRQVPHALVVPRGHVSQLHPGDVG